MKKMKKRRFEMGKKLLVALLMVGLILCFCQAEKCLDKSRPAEYLGVNPERPFSEAVRSGDFLILSGQLGMDPQTGKLVPGGILKETRQTMENIKNTLEKYGSSMDRVVKCTVMLADIRDWGDMNKVYVTYFPGHKPARSAFGTQGLALNARVEIECWAIPGPSNL
jgi:2-iminobutanoate/2-iminopropanoate deaminase